MTVRSLDQIKQKIISEGASKTPCILASLKTQRKDSNLSTKHLGVFLDLLFPLLMRFRKAPTDFLSRWTVVSMSDSRVSDGRGGTAWTGEAGGSDEE